MPISFARKNKTRIDWDNYQVPQPAFTGIKVLHDYPLEKIKKQIDWTPFFQTWELFGKYPEILKDEKVGTEATKLFNDANQLLDEVVSKNS